MGKRKLETSECCDPFESGRRIHKSNKKKISSVKKISPTLLKSFQEYFPELELHSQSLICLYCRFLANNKIKDLQAKNDQDDEMDDADNDKMLEDDTMMSISVSVVPELSDMNEKQDVEENASSYTVQSCTTGPSPTEVQVADLNYHFHSLLKTPIRIAHKTQPRRIQKKWKEVNKSMKKKFGRFTGRPLPKESCNHCDDLLTDLVKKFESLDLKKDKYLCLTSVPRRFGESEIIKKIEKVAPFIKRSIHILVKLKIGFKTFTFFYCSN